MNSHPAGHPPTGQASSPGLSQSVSWPGRHLQQRPDFTRSQCGLQPLEVLCLSREEVCRGCRAAGTSGRATLLRPHYYYRGSQIRRLSQVSVAVQGKTSRGRSYSCAEAPSEAVYETQKNKHFQANTNTLRCHTRLKELTR